MLINSYSIKGYSIIWIILFLLLVLILYIIIPYYKLPNNFNKEEAQKILNDHLEKYRTKDYQELLVILQRNEPITYDIDMGNNKFYQFEVDCSWENKATGDTILITISIDNGGRSAYHPLTNSVIVEKSDK